MSNRKLELKWSTYNPSDDVSKFISKQYKRMSDCWELHKQGWRYFNDMSCDEYIDESVSRWVSYVEPRDEGDWKSKLFMPETRNKIIAILAYVTARRTRAKIIAKKTGLLPNESISRILDVIYNNTLDHEIGDQKFFRAALEAAVKGTVFVYKGFDYEERDVKIVKKINPNTGVTEWDKKE